MLYNFDPVNLIVNKVTGPAWRAIGWDRKTQQKGMLQLNDGYFLPDIKAQYLVGRVDNF